MVPGVLVFSRSGALGKRRSEKWLLADLPFGLLSSALVATICQVKEHQNGHSAIPVHQTIGGFVGHINAFAISFQLNKYFQRMLTIYKNISN